MQVEAGQVGGGHGGALRRVAGVGMGAGRFGPPHALRVQRGRQALAHRVEHRVHGVLALHFQGDVAAQHRVVHAPEQHGVDEADDEAVQPGGDERGSHPEREHHAHRDRSRRQRGGQAVAGKRNRDERNQGERALQEEVGQCEAVVLVEDGKRQRDGRVVTHQFHGPAVFTAMEAAQVRGRHGEQGQRQHPQRAAEVRLAAREHAEGQDDQPVTHREQQEGQRRGGRVVGGHRVEVQHRGRCAEPIRHAGDDAPARQAARHRVHHHRGQHAESRERQRPQADRLVEIADARQAVCGKLAQVPHQAQQRGGQRQPVARAPAQHQREQHGVERRARGEPDEVQDLRGVRHAVILLARKCRSASVAIASLQTETPN